MPNRVLYICGGRSFNSSNPGNKIAGVVNCWNQMGYNVLHVCGGDILNIGTGKLKEYGAVSYHRKWYRQIGILNPLIRSISEYRDIRHDKVMIQHLEEVCNSFKPDIVWERSCRLHNAGLVLARRLGVPYVLEWKDNIASYKLSWFVARARHMENNKNHEADFIVTESEVLRSDLIKKGIDGTKIIVAPNAVNTDRFCANANLRVSIRRDLGITNDIVLVGYLGSYAWYHDTGRLVKAMDILHKRGVWNVCCLMVGTGKEYDNTYQLAKKHGLLNNTVIMKQAVPADEVPGILAALDIAVLPGSTDIICPIKIQEYMASELATLAPDYACNREVIEDGQTGMLFTPKDEWALAKKILTLVKDKKTLHSIGKKARNEMKCSFSWENTWGTALQRVLKNEK